MFEKLVRLSSVFSEWNAVSEWCVVKLLAHDVPNPYVFLFQLFSVHQFRSVELSVHETSDVLYVM